MIDFPFQQACARLIENIELLNLTIKPEYLTPQDVDQFAAGMHLTPLERTPLYDLVLDSFEESVRWLGQLKDQTYYPDWHLVDIDPDTSPIELDDWMVAATSKAEAVAAVIEAMTYQFVAPTGVREDDQKMIIMGETGPIATIEKIRFTKVAPESELRAQNALRGLELYNDLYVVKKALAKIQGLADLGIGEPQLKHRKHADCLYPTPSNLCTCLVRILEDVLEEEVPRYAAQELLANFFGFETWQHFVALAKSRADAVERPYEISIVDRNGIGKPIAFAKGLPCALHVYGQMLRKQLRSKFHVNQGSDWQLHNFTLEDSKTFLRTGYRYKEPEGLTMSALSRTYPSEEFMIVAASLLDSPDFETNLKGYLNADLEREDQIVALNTKRGIRKEDHLFLSEWCCYIERDRWEEVIWFKALDGRPEPFNIGASLKKASLNKHGDNYWLATDWNRKPKYELPGLTDSEAKEIERRFFSKLNWQNYGFED